MSYNTENINVQFLNQSLINKVCDEGLTKEASVASSAFVRLKLREESFARKLFDTTYVTAAELDRQLTDEPAVIIEKEPDSDAATIPFTGRAEPRYFKANRYAVTFTEITSKNFVKSKFELMTYRTDIRTILQENSVKDLQKVEDQSFYNNAMAIAQAYGNYYQIAAPSTVFGDGTIQKIQTAIKYLIQKQIPVGKILMTQSMYADILKQPATQVGSGRAGELYSGQGNLDNLFGYPIVTTNKNDILPDNRIMVLGTAPFLGQYYLLQDSTVTIRTGVEGPNMISFQTSESVGLGIGNVNSIIVADI